MKNGEVHSEEWINDAREYWWNKDYLELILKRYNLQNITSLADIGCGKGYMTFKLLPLLNKLNTCYGIDIEKTHIEDAKNISNKYSGIAFNFSVDDATNLKIPAETVDLCICQTLLLHLPNPQDAIFEMKRITKNDGTIIAIETNNSINSLVSNSFVGENKLHNIQDIEKTVEKLKYELTIQKGIYNLNEGYLSIGDYVPKLFLEAGLKDIQVSIVDKACSLIPPYDTPEKQSRAKELLEWIDCASAEFDYNQMLKYYLAGGGNQNDFDKIWNIEQQEAQKIKQAILDETYIIPGGALMYIITAKK